MNSSVHNEEESERIEFEASSTANPGSSTTNISSLLRDPNKPLGSRSPEPEDLLRLSAKIHQARKNRSIYLSPDLFSEPGWEMLLALYRADAAGHRMTVSNLCFASNAPDTTALRWIEKLVELGVVYRKVNPYDARSTFVELEAGARDAVHAYLLDVWTTFYD